jgi:outer membrane protein assembly factor BamD
LFRFPNSEKAAQARSNLQQLEHKAISSSFEVARFYDKQKMYRAAVIYYNEVIRQQPGSAESEKAKKRIDQLRAKVGEKMLEPLQDAEKKKAAEQTKTKEPGQSAPAANSAPILPPDVDTSLPPPPSGPSSLLPPGSSSAPASEATPEPSSTPAESAEPSAAPSSPDDSSSSEATASPTP